MIEALEAAKDEREAFPAALALWRACRDPALGDLVEKLGAKLASARIPPGAGFHEAWLTRAAAHDPADVPPLLEALPRKPEDEYGGLPWRPAELRYRPMLRRVEALAEFGDDPRIARGLADLVRKAPFSVPWQAEHDPAYAPLFALIARMRDATSVERLRDLHARPVHRSWAIRGYLARALPEALATMSVAPPVAPELRARIDAALQRWEVPGDSPVAGGAALLAAVYADPDDDGAREVYGDWLLDRRDPRGELIALQTKGAAKDHARIQSLIRKHTDAWLGEIAAVTKHRVFRRGFLDQADLVTESSATPELWARVLEDERLSTVRDLRRGKANEALFVRFLASPARRSLRTVTAVTSRTVQAMAEAKEPFAIEHVRLERPSRDAMRALATTTKLPKLRAVTLVASERIESVLERFAQSKLGARLERVMVDPGPKRLQLPLLLDALENLGVAEYGVRREAPFGTTLRVRGAGAQRSVVLEGFLSVDDLKQLPACARLELRGLPLTEFHEQFLRTTGPTVLRLAREKTADLHVDPALTPFLEGA